MTVATNELTLLGLLVFFLCGVVFGFGFTVGSRLASKI